MNGPGVDCPHPTQVDPVDAWMNEGLALAGEERFAEAVRAFSMALVLDPGNERCLRHRGHRYITTGDYAAAASDLSAATRLDTGKRDSWYHFGLALYLLRDYGMAAQAWERALALSASDEERVSPIDWLWAALLRLGRREEAGRLVESMGETADPGKNRSYHARVMLYSGRWGEDETWNAVGGDRSGVELANTGYGVANWMHERGRTGEAVALLHRIVEECPKRWAFGYLAAAADLASREAAGLDRPPGRGAR